QDHINACAARMSEALTIANEIVKSRAAIAAFGKGHGDGHKYCALGHYAYLCHGKLCPHGVARCARSRRALPSPLEGAQARVEGARQGAGRDRRQDGFPLLRQRAWLQRDWAHRSVEQDRSCRHAYWGAQKIWFWQLG